MQIEINIDYSAISKEAIYDWFDKKAKEQREKARKKELEKKRQKEEYEKTPLLIRKLTESLMRYWVIGVIIFVSLLVFDQINNASDFPTLFPSFEAIRNFGLSLIFLPTLFFILLRIVEFFTTKRGLGKIKEKVELIRDSSKDIIKNLQRK